MKNVYIVGSKGIPARYGGFETFVEKLTEYKKNDNIQYHVACMADNSLKSGIRDKHFEHNGAKCFNIDVPNIGPAKAIFYDIAALNYAVKLAEKNNDVNPIFYVLASRIGPFIGKLKKKIDKLNGKLFVNPDGHEWKRAKWSYPVRKYWKYSERLMVKNADLLICDSKNIEKYILKVYEAYKPKTDYIAYGTETNKSELSQKSSEVISWFSNNSLNENNYYLVVGRFVPENNYESMIRGFMSSSSRRDFVLVTNIQENKFYEKLKKKTHFDEDNRIKFVGTVYNQELLKYIRENAFAYIHGHEVGGTNPSLLEALASTKINLLLNVGFNKEVGKDSALYWNKNQLQEVISKAEQLSSKEIQQYEIRAKRTIEDHYTWRKIINDYEKVFMECGE
ncbi:beta 1-4 rhamnosyltransferase Cps2T [Enterococcus sp. LJL90]